MTAGAKMDMATISLPVVREHDPSRDARYDISAQSGVVEPVDKVFFSKLASGVIDADRCIQCASCILVCPSKSIAVAMDERPTLVKMCTGCSLCWDFCPRGGLRTETLWDVPREGEAHPVPPGQPGLADVKGMYTAQTKSRIGGEQDGGVATAIVRSLFEKGEIDAAIVARRNPHNQLKGEAFLAKSVEDLKQCTGSFFNQTLPLSLLKDIVTGGGVNGITKDSRLAFVGTPCEVAGIDAVQRFPWKYSGDGGLKLVKYSIALMCTRNFDYARSVAALKARGIDLSKAKRMDVTENIMRLYDENDKVIFEDNVVKVLKGASLKGCDECADFTGRMADITVGAIGSEPRHSSVLVRTAAGEKAWKLSQDAVISRPMDKPELIEKVDAKNTIRAQKALKRKFDPNLSVRVPYSEHLSSYEGSDRAPVKAQPFRIHHYETKC